MTKLLLLLALLFLGYLWWKGKAAPPAAMPRDNAARLLGVASNADAATVIEAHRRLIAKVHPDAGGSAELAAQINLARDSLLQSGRERR